VKAPDSVLRRDHLIRILEGEGFARAPFVDLLPPGLERGLIDLHRSGAPQPHHVFEHVRAIADDGKVALEVLVDGRRIDVDVDLLRAWREGIEPTADAVV